MGPIVLALTLALPPAILMRQASRMGAPDTTDEAASWTSRDKLRFLLIAAVPVAVFAVTVLRDDVGSALATSLPIALGVLLVGLVTRGFRAPP